MIKIKLALRGLTDAEVVGYSKVVGAKLNGNVNFPVLPVSSAVLTTDGGVLGALLQQRAAMESQMQQLTLQIRSARDKCVSDLNINAAFIQQTINTLVPPATAIDGVVAAAKAQSAGMDVANAYSSVGEMPKVEGLKTAQGADNGEIDLKWARIQRGLKNYTVEMTTDATGEKGWQIVATPSKSSVTVRGLHSGTRHWFRVSANGTAGPGPASEARSRIAP